MEQVNVKDLKEQVSQLWERDRSDEVIDMIEKAYNTNIVSQRLTNSQLVSSDELLFELEDSAGEVADELEVNDPDTDSLRDILDKIDEVSGGTNDDDVALWDVSSGNDEARPADKKDVFEVIDELASWEKEDELNQSR